jgi:predicted nucleic acid-binding protein
VIILDTTVLSALMRTEPEQAVVGWLDDQPAESVWTTSVTVFEVRTGLELLEPSRRRSQLESAFAGLLADELGGRVLRFDVPAAEAAAPMVARAQRAGRPVEVRDAQIAGIVRSRRATLVTRNVRHFKDFGVRLVNPWDPDGHRGRRDQRATSTDP